MSALVVARTEVPEWTGQVPVRAVVPPDTPRAALRESAEGAPCALVDADAGDPVDAARRLHAADPAVQVVLVAREECRRDLERAMLFAPGLGEVWIVAPPQVDPALVERARVVSEQRRRYATTRQQVAREIARAEPRRDARALVSDAYLAALLDVLPDPVASVDENGLVLSWNPAAERVLGVSRRMASGRPLAEVVRLEPPAAMAELLETGRRRHAHGEIVFRRRTGEPGTAEASVVPVEAAGHHVRAVVLRDVTQQREAQAELESQAAELQNQAAELEVLNTELADRGHDLERALAARSRFYAAMSHELRTPINAIMGYNALLLDGIFGALEDKQEDGLQRAQNAARHLLELVNDVLDLAKIEAGRIELEVEPTAVPDLLDGLMDTVRPMAEKNDTPIVRAAGRERCRAVPTDPRRVRQILLNLLSNAIKFGAGSPIGLACEPTSAGGVAVEVSDSGPGIPPDQIERIFEEFTQAPGDDREGTGLGLSISRRLAQLLGGSLTVRSTPGVGSTFRLELPAQPPAQAANPVA